MPLLILLSIFSVKALAHTEAPWPCDAKAIAATKALARVNNVRIVEASVIAREMGEGDTDQLTVEARTLHDIPFKAVVGAAQSEGPCRVFSINAEWP